MSNAAATDWDDDVADEVRHLPALVPSGAMPALSTIELAPKAWKLALRIAATPFAPKGLAGKPESVLAAMLVGNELGLPLMTSLAKVHVIDGRPGLAAETMRALVLARGHEMWFESKSTTSVTVCGKRAGSPREQKVTWTIEDARAAKLVGKDNWQKYPRGMLAARASSELCRDLFPDVIGGLYSLEELADGFDFEQLLDDEEPTAAAAPAKKVSSPAAKKRAATRARAAAGEGPEPEPPPLPDDEDIVDAVVVDEDTPPPPLPDDEPTEPPPVVRDLQDKVDRAQGAQSMSRAQKIAMRADELGVDRHHVIAAVTAGAKSSGNELDDTEADMVDEALRRLKVGEIRLEQDDEGWCLVDAPEVPNDDAGAGDEHLAEVVQMDSAGWRAHVKAKGSTLSKTLAYATRWAHEHELVPPTDIGSLAEADANLQVAVLTWLEDDG